MVSHSRETTSGYRCWRHTKKLRVGTGNCKDKKAEEWKWQKQQRWVMRSFQRLDVVFKCHPLSSDCFLWMRVFQCHSVWETISPFFPFFFFVCCHRLRLWVLFTQRKHFTGEPELFGLFSLKTTNNKQSLWTTGPSVVLWWCYGGTPAV